MTENEAIEALRLINNLLKLEVQITEESLYNWRKRMGICVQCGKEKKAIERIRIASEMSLKYYEKPLVCTYSAGKDSDVMLELFIRSGIPFEVHNSHTTADAPQTVRHIRKVFKNIEENGIRCEIEMPQYQGKRISMWSLIPLKLMPPTRMVRYCCSILKETGCKNRYIATGVRWDERKKEEKEGSLKN